MIHLRKYGVQTTVDFDLFEVDGVDFRVDAVHASGDSAIMKDEGTEANTTNSFTDEGNGYSIVLTATEMQAERVQLYLIDQTATKIWLDRTVTVETYGDASAQHAFDLDTASTAQTGDSFARIGAAGVSLTDLGGMSTGMQAEVNTEADAAIVTYGLDNMVFKAAVGSEIADDSIIASMVSLGGTADWDTFVNTTDSLEALRERGDAAWTTGGGGSITDIVQWKTLIPQAIDLANTKTWRFAIALTNQLDDLPTTAEITPGTISIDRAAQGGTTWAAIVTDAAMSESAGLIFFDEVFDTATGYASGDVLRITMKGQSITVSANDYEISDGANGIIEYTGIIADTPDVNIAEIGGSAANVAAMNLFFSIIDAGTGQLDAGSFAADAIGASAIENGALTGAKQGTGWVTNVQSGLATAAALTTVDTEVGLIQADLDNGTDGLGAIKTAVDTVDTVVDGIQTDLDNGTDGLGALLTAIQAVETDTQNIQSRIPTVLSGGFMQSDMQAINTVDVVGDGSGTPFTV